jgi:hypothetical protein
MSALTQPSPEPQKQPVAQPVVAPVRHPADAVGFGDCWW